MLSREIQLFIRHNLFRFLRRFCRFRKLRDFRLFRLIFHQAFTLRKDRQTELFLPEAGTGNHGLVNRFRTDGYRLIQDHLSGRPKLHPGILANTRGVNLYGCLFPIIGQMERCLGGGVFDLPKALVGHEILPEHLFLKGL